MLRTGFLGLCLKTLIQQRQLVLVVEHRDDILKPFAKQVDDILHIQLFLEAIAHNHLVLVDQPLGMQLLNQVDVERR